MLVRHHLKPSLGHIALRDLRPEHVQRFYNERKKLGLSARTVRYLHIDYNAVVERVLKGGSDEEILAWCHQQGRPLTDEEILIFNSFMSKRGWRDDETDDFIPSLKREYGFADDDGIKTDFDVIEADEGRPVDMWRRGWELPMK